MTEETKENRPLTEEEVNAYLDKIIPSNEVLENFMTYMHTLITEPDFAEEKELAMTDDSGVTLLSIVLDGLDDLESEGEITDYIIFTLTMLKEASHQLIEESGVKYINLLLEIRKLIKNDQVLRHSFTPEEAKVFVSSISSKKFSEDLCLLDQITGIYLAMMALENLAED